jgi:hypothetical protein
MPFVSNKQRAWMYSQHPEMAKTWQAHTPKGAKLPDHVKDKKAKKALGKKVAVALQNQPLIPGAPPVQRVVPTQPAPAKAAPRPPQPQPAPTQQAQPQTPAPATATAGKGSSSALTTQKIQAVQKATPGAINPAEAVVAQHLNKMASDALADVRLAYIFGLVNRK